MTKQEITNALITNHKKFTDYISSLDDTAFMFSLNNEKWTAGQQAEHIYRSVSPLALVLRFPKWAIKYKFGTSNRVSKNYEALVQKYSEKLGAGGKASGRFVPEKIDANQKAVIKSKIEKLVSKMCTSLNRYSEKDLDTLILPHPLLGKVTLREMMYFTIHHVEHHHKITVRNLGNKI